MLHHTPVPDLTRDRLAALLILGWSASRAARLYRVPRSTVEYRRNRWSLRRQDIEPARRVRDDPLIVADFCAGMTYADMERKWHMWSRHILRLVMAVAPESKRPTRPPKFTLDAEELRALWVSGLTHEQIAARYGCGSELVGKTLRAAGYRSRNVIEPAAPCPKPAPCGDPHAIREVWDAGYKQDTIGRQCGVRQPRVSRTLKSAGLNCMNRAKPEDRG